MSVIPDDRTIVIDGVGRRCEFQAPEGVHAIQWDGAVGMIEMKPGYPEAKPIEDVGELALYLAAWEAAESPPPLEPPAEVIADPVEKLRAFLVANPDVAQLINGGVP